VKLAVIVTDAGQAANVAGGVCTQTVRVFDAPDDMAKYITSSLKLNIYTAVTLAVVSEGGGQ
jgi:hypothetical protein